MADVQGLTLADADDMKERETFEMFDRDGNGTISKSELGKIMHALGQDVTQKELEDILTRFDDDQSGTINYEEYKAIIDANRVSHLEMEIQLREAFLVFDRDKSGTLDREELKAVLTEMGEPLNMKQTEHVLNKIDLNGDGKIEVDEFVKFLCCKV